MDNIFSKIHATYIVWNTKRRIFIPSIHLYHCIDDFGGGNGVESEHIKNFVPIRAEGTAYVDACEDNIFSKLHATYIVWNTIRRIFIPSIHLYHCIDNFGGGNKVESEHIENFVHIRAEGPAQTCEENSFSIHHATYLVWNTAQHVFIPSIHWYHCKNNFGDGNEI